ncbi:hypothetical protein ATANTOWER_016837 [Ataeniobius toweri]|uniref:Uncharacterized protein n=1 Tax=Ataeniobius toweri TaxID=208326 RepID=A0ABU7C2D5_9TELE|nr:hypothetical protein [Ataeniobius toweri]
MCGVLNERERRWKLLYINKAFKHKGFRQCTWNLGNQCRRSMIKFVVMSSASASDVFNSHLQESFYQIPVEVGVDDVLHLYCGCCCL